MVMEYIHNRLFTGTYYPYGVAFEVDRAEVEKMLPRKLALISDADKVPIFFTVGRQSIGPTIIPLSERYQEAIFSIPNVRLVDQPDSGPFVYQPFLYVSRLLPILVNRLYGFPKKLATFEETENGLVIREVLGRGFVELRFTDADVARPISSYAKLSNAAWNMPAVTFSGPLTLRSKMHFSGKQMVQPSQVEAWYEIPELPWLPQHVVYPAMQNHTFGGFKMYQRYEFGLPRLLKDEDHTYTARPWPEGKRKIAILGGGVGAMTAAYAITSLPNWQDNCELTIYQQGWRLGGKGASGRNADHAQRIEEHGLHVWAGFYDNAFRLFQECYRDLEEAGLDDGIFPSWRAAFKTQSQFIQNDKNGDEWTQLVASWPENNAIPGSDQEFLEPHDYLHMLLFFLKEFFTRPPEGIANCSSAQNCNDVTHDHDLFASLLSASDHLEEMMPPPVSGLAGEITHAVESTALHAAFRIFSRLRSTGGQGWLGEKERALLDGVDNLLKEFQEKLEEILEEIGDDEPKKLLWYYVMSLGVAVARGLIGENVLAHGFDTLNKYDLREFLDAYGVSEKTRESQLVRGGYDYVFAFKEGDIDQPSFAAGVAVRGALRVFLTYKGALMWKMNAGMGDTIFTPYYKILKHRGVKFEFFTRVKALRVGDTAISSIELERQATLNNPAAGYDPLVRIGDLDCWPDRPDYDQLVEGDELKDKEINLESFWADWPGTPETLQKGTDFDDVILGIPPGAYQHICQDLANSSVRWKKMAEEVKTVQTKAMQLWLKPNLTELGFENGDGAISTAYVERFSTWADMSHLLPVEQWQATNEPNNIAYFCGVLQDAANFPAPPDPAFADGQLSAVEGSGWDWLDDNIAHLWKNAVKSDDTFNKDLLVDGGSFFKANIDPSERYVLSTPNSLQYRLEAHDTPFDNLYMAGDWVQTSINAGCVEAATIGGLKAARGVTNQLVKISDEPDGLVEAPLL